MASVTAASGRLPSSASAGSCERSISRDGPAPCLSSAASASARRAQERDAALGLPDIPITGTDTFSSSKAIGRDSNRGDAADHGACWAGRPVLLGHLIPIADAPDRPLSYNTSSDKRGNT